MTYSSLPDAVAGFQDNAGRVDAFANGGPDDAYTTTDGRQVPSLSKFIGDNQANIDEAAASVPIVNGLAAAASASASAASSARDAALIQSGVYIDEPTGRAAVTDGQAFKVQGSGDVAAYEYRRVDASTSVLIAQYPSTAFIDENFNINPFLADYVPVVVDDQGNVAVHLEGGKLGAANGLSDDLMAGIVGRPYFDGLFSSNPFDADFFPVIADGSGNVVLWFDSGLLCARGLSSDLLPPTIVAAPPSTPGYSLYSWRAKLAAILGGNGIAKVVFTGDSWTEHLNETATALSQALYTAYGQSGNGWVSVHADEPGGISQLLNGATLVKSSGWTLYDMDPANSNSLDGHAVYATGTTDTITISGLKTQALKWYYKDDSGTFRYTVDGGSPVTVAGGGTGTLKSIAISGLADATHSIVFDLVGNAGTVTMYGGYATRTASGVEFSKAGNGGSTTTQWGPVSPMSASYISEINPDVIVIILGTNDSRQSVSNATFKQQLNVVLTAYRSAAPNAAIVLVAPPPNGDASSVPALLTSYRDAMNELAQSVANVELLNLYAFLPGYSVTQPMGLWGDALHLSAAGGRVVSGLLMNKFLKAI
ncbi:SGNH/GDSL hydrolase family protein [Burkholderia sp. IDO3]|uniref:SGNH/GDSL hydrolase family protein n=1 Tax=Burkholderia sp. IDO3 TaxID=1705310 RepID=UPI000BBA72C7|nr:SGNH/GDSL hydrolase family protein [Burkholderia sp. IDO3]AXK61548.1 SGNH/GDSL hydrolase family protein [Burkholderia sp. IDO3]PCD58157.1 hypothetical protein CN645_30175 [Burkholderia sp. IDO3]